MTTAFTAQDLPGLTAVYLQPASDNVEACLIAEFDPASPKGFARLWLSPRRLEWGWTLHPSAVPIWQANQDSTEAGMAP